MEEKAKPKDPQSPKPRPIVANPSTPGVQPTNRPDGKTLPRAGEDRR